MTFISSIPIKAGDKINLEFPAQIKPPDSAEKLACAAILNLKNLSCELIGTKAIVTVIEAEELPNGGTYQLTLSNVKNAFSLKTTDGFTGINVVSK